MSSHLAEQHLAQSRPSDSITTTLSTEIILYLPIYHFGDAGSQPAGEFTGWLWSSADGSDFISMFANYDSSQVEHIVLWSSR